MIRLKVAGMSCAHCVHAITDALRGLPGVQGVAVSLAEGEVIVEGEAGERALRDAIAAEGYDVQAASRN